MKPLYFLSLALCLAAGNLAAQNFTDPLGDVYLTPDRMMDTVYDNHGKKIPLKSLAIYAMPPYVNQVTAVSTSCTAGYFNIFYATNSGFDQISNPVHIAKRDILCKLFTDISNLVNSPLSVVTNTTRVNILIDDPASALAQNPSFMGGGGCLYSVAGNPSSSAPGIADCEAYKTIISGVDSYSNVAAPLSTLNGSGNFYHGTLVFNPNISWNLNINTATMVTQTDVDLYTVALHEAMHVLGFGSLITYGGNSVFGAGNNYYSRYDKFLTNAAGVPLLTNGGPSCYNYSVSFNVLASAIAPGSCSNSPSQVSNCSNAARYIGSTNVAVFTPSCYVSGSSLSHFEDMCSTPGSFTTACSSIPSGSNNDLYFAMSDAGYAGNCGIKRYLKPEEKKVLCDLGYSLNSWYNPSSGATYAATVTAAAQFNYSVSCGTNMPIGINDGLTLGNYIYVSSTPTLTIPLSAIIANDYNTASATCIQSVYNNGAVTVSGGNITFVANAGVGGIVLLRYLPQSSTGVTGNITYIYAFITPQACVPPSACNIVQNGSFESVSSFSCGPIPSATSPISCWTNLAGGSATPDLYVSSPCGAYQLGVNTFFNNPPVNTYNAPNPGNQNLVGITASLNAAYSEQLKNYLSSPLVPGQVYVLSCWLYSQSALNSTVNQNGLPVVFSFASDQSFGSNFNAPTFPGSLNTLADFTITPIKTWVPCVQQFTFGATQSHNVIYIGINTPKTILNGYPYLINNYPYVYVDNISILPASQSPTSTLPAMLPCTSSSLSNLGAYLQPPGGTFSGPGVSYNGVQYDFNAAQTLTPGLYGISYSYTTNLGCPQTIGFPITISSYTGTPVFSLPPSLCQNSTTIPDMSVTISPTVLATGSAWAGNGVMQMSPSLYMFSNITNFMPLGLNTYTYTHAACAITLTTTVNNLPPFVVSVANTASQTCISPGQSATLSASSASAGVSYTWLPQGVTSSSSVIVSPSVTTVYTLTGLPAAAPCPNTQTVAVGVMPPITFTNLPTAWCAGQNVMYLDNYLAAGTPTNGTWTAPGSYTAIINTNSLVTGANLSATTPGTYVISYACTAPTGCSLGKSFTVAIVPTPTLSTNGTVTYCSNLGIALPLTASSSGTFATTYTWQPGNMSGATVSVSPGSNTIYTVTANNGVCPVPPGTVAVNVSTACCQATNYITSSTIPTGTYSGQWAINQNVTINGTVTLLGEFLMAPNVTITVPNGSMLAANSISATGSYVPVHLHSCGDMWYGIRVENGGRVMFTYPDLIEDALVAIQCVSNNSSLSYTSTTNCDIYLSQVVFNRNYIGVSIESYTQMPITISPFYINGNVFTSRDFSVPANSLSWPNASNLISTTTPTAPLASPYTLQNYTPANLKAPYSSQPSDLGIYVQNSGVTSFPSSGPIVFYNIPLSNNFFDNHLYGINSYNSNVLCYGSVFQNARTVTTTILGTTYVAGGFGIYAGNGYNYAANFSSNLDLVAPSSPSTNNNKFYDCLYGVNTYNIFRLNAQYLEVRSTQSSATPTALTNSGQYGIYAGGNKFYDFNIKNNQFLNLRTCVYISAYRAALNIPGIFAPQGGEYWGRAEISNNLFCPAAGVSISAGTGYVNSGVQAENALSSPLFVYGLNASSGLYILNNTFDRVWHGVTLNGFTAFIVPALTGTNSIGLVQDPSGLKQWGINLSNSRSTSILSNTITGFSATNAMVSGIYQSLSGSAAISCNSVANVYNGFEFAGLNNNPQWISNTMHYNTHGLLLSNSGIIGTQGSYGQPSDNLWDGTWTNGVNFGTWTDNSSFATNSKLYVRSATGYFPPNNSGVSIPNSYFTTGNLLSAYSGASYAACLTPYTPLRQNSDSGLVDLELLTNVATDRITYTVNVDQTREMNKLMLYDLLAQDAPLRSSSGTLQDFYTGNASSALAAVADIKVTFAAGDLSGGQTLLDAFGPSSDLQSTIQLFYQVYANYLQGAESLSPDDEVSLAGITQLCPYTSGPVVYQARALYNRAHKTALLYSDEGCGEGTPDGRKLHYAANAGEVYILYPNPASNEVFIKANKQKTQLTLLITDVNGQQLVSKKLMVTDYLVSLKVNLLNGIYFVNLIDETGACTIKKLVISK